MAAVAARPPVSRPACARLAAPLRAPRPKAGLLGPEQASTRLAQGRVLDSGSLTETGVGDSRAGNVGSAFSSASYRRAIRAHAFETVLKVVDQIGRVLQAR